MKQPSMLELASRIRAHLRRFEADPIINKPNGNKLRPFYYASAGYSGRGPKLAITYVSYQHHTMLTKDEATRYLAKLDAGFVGRHYEALRDATPASARTAE